MKAAEELGLGPLLKFFFMSLAMIPYRLALFPPVRVFLARLYGARIGKRVVLHNARFFNLYRRGFAGWKVGNECFIGDECLFDLADSIEMHDQVTVAERVLILTHTNVGYHDHPLQKHFPASVGPVVLEQGCFLGVQCVILPGVRVGRGSFIAAGAVVTEDVPEGVVVAGVPARVIRKLD